MMRTLFVTFGAVLGLVLLADVNVGLAQSSGRGGRLTQTFTGDVRFQGSHMVSGNTIAIVAANVVRNLRGEDVYADKPGSVIMIQFRHSSAQRLTTGSDVGSDVANEPGIRTLSVTAVRADGGIELPAEEMAAIWEKARQQFEDGLRKFQATMRENQLRERERKIQSARDALASCRDDYEHTVERLSKLARDLDGASQPEIQQQLAATLAELRQLKVKMIGLQARRDAVERRIDELRAVAEKTAADDPVIEELKRIVEIRTEFVQMMRERQKARTAEVTGLDVQGADAQLAEARIQLLKAQREAAQLAQGDALLQLNNELSMLIIQSAELEATIKATEEIAGPLRDKASARYWSELDLLRLRVERAKSRLIEAEQAIYERENQPLPPLEEISIHPLDEVLAPAAEPAAP